MSTRLNFLPDERFAPLRTSLKERLQKMAELITPENFPSLLDFHAGSLLRDVFAAVRADEGSVWILDQSKEHLVVSYASGPHAADIMGFKQPLSAGIVSTSFISEQGFAENEVYRNELHSGLLDEKLHVMTYGMIVVPFYILNACQGVISCVQLINVRHEGGRSVPVADTPSGFSMGSLDAVKRAALILTDLVNYRLLRTAIGWEAN
ncbi:MAG: hypothetical protein JOZ08_09990 [Verrucomicrobia bacterium]|nr:hypothetical protein [Verrucomicrobiota bacterium]MBV8279720.1 hypothetical protein [Verrucomicrobiota bacterium]